MNIESQNLEVVTELLYDQAFRRKVQNKDPDALALLGFETSDDAPELKVVSSTRNKTYFPLPLQPDNYRISGTELGQIQAAGSAGSASTGGSVGSVCSVCTTISTAGTASSLGTAGSAG